MTCFAPHWRRPLLNHFRGRRVVEVDGRLAEHGQGDVRQRAAGAGREPDGDHTLVAEERLQCPREADRAGERLAVGELLLRAAVVEAGTERVPGRDAHEAAVHRLALRGAGDGAVGRQLLYRLAYVGGPRLRRHRFAEGDGDVVRQLLRHLPQDAAAGPAEDAAPHLVEADGDDRRLGVLDDLLEAAGERQHQAGARDAPLGEDADHFPAGQGVGRLPQRLDDAARPGAAVDGNDARHAQKVADAPGVEKRGEDHEADEPALRRQQQQPVDVADVVADEQRRAGRGHVFLAERAHAVKGAPDHPQQAAEEVVREQPGQQQTAGDDEDRNPPPRPGPVGKVELGENASGPSGCHDETPATRKRRDGVST